MSNCPSAIQTFTGVFINPFDPDPALLDIRDIAHALSNQCRFSGHTKKFWSVAAHSCLVSLLVEPEHKLQALLHDATEAICVDVPRPIKKHPSFQVYRDVEASIRLAVSIRFGLDYALPESVHHADNVALWAEADELLHGTLQWCDDRPTAHMGEIMWARAQIREILELDDERLFLEQYKVLTGVDVHAHV
jgi:uncharacterized protein